MSELYVVRTGVPIPPATKGGYGRKSPVRLFMENLQPGQSIFTPETDKRPLHAIYHLKKMGMKFTTRRVEENGIKGYGIWRTE